MIYDLMINEYCIFYLIKNSYKCTSEYAVRVCNTGCTVLYSIYTYTHITHSARVRACVCVFRHLKMYVCMYCIQCWLWMEFLNAAHYPILYSCWHHTWLKWMVNFVIKFSHLSTNISNMGLDMVSLTHSLTLDFFWLNFYAIKIHPEYIYIYITFSFTLTCLLTDLQFRRIKIR